MVTSKQVFFCCAMTSGLARLHEVLVNLYSVKGSKSQKLREENSSENKGDTIKQLNWRMT